MPRSCVVRLVLVERNGGMEYQDTSREALQSLSGVTGDVDRTICAALDAAGTVGLTDHEVEQRTGYKHQTVSADRRHLVERGVVCKTILRGMLPSGRKAIRWVLAKHFDHAIHSDEPCVAVGPKSQKSLF